MKMKKFIIPIIVCLVAFALVFVNISQTQKVSLQTTILDTEKTDGTAMAEEKNHVIEITDNETPLVMIIGPNKGNVRALSVNELDRIRNNLINSVNKERKTGAANILVSQNDTLEETGTVRAKEIIKKWSHTRPNGSNWSTVLVSHGISTNGLMAGEDLAKISMNAKADYKDAFIDQVSDAIHQSLMNSPTHKSVILDKNYRQIGIGITSKLEKGKVTVYVTEHFKNNPSSKSSKKNVSKLKYSTVSNKTYTGKAIKPGITVKDGSKTLKNGKDYTLTYSANKNPGKATITIKGKGNYTGSVKKTFNIVPKAPSLKVVSAKKSAKVTTKSTGANGYIVEYSLKKNMSGKKSVTITKTSGTIKKLTSKKTYYIRVRAYKTIGGKKYYSPYSSVKSVKVK